MKQLCFALAVFLSLFSANLVAQEAHQTSITGISPVANIDLNNNAAVQSKCTPFEVAYLTPDPACAASTSSENSDFNIEVDVLCCCDTPKGMCCNEQNGCFGIVNGCYDCR